MDLAHCCLFELYGLAATPGLAAPSLVAEHFCSTANVFFENWAQPPLLEVRNEWLVLFGTAASEKPYLPNRSRVIWIAVAPQTSLAALAMRVDMEDITSDTPVARPEASSALVDFGVFTLRSHLNLTSDETLPGARNHD
jgi:hypothetical protein